MITVEVNDEDGTNHRDALVNWKHDADNQQIIKINPRGFVFGNIIGKTRVYAGAGEGDDKIWSEMPTEVEVIKSDGGDKGGRGYPQLKMTGRNIDEFTGKVRPNNPDEPALWQDVQDVQKNVWWLNMGSKDANFAYSLRETNKSAWRLFHAKILIEMMIQAWMGFEYTKKGDEEKPDLWSSHKGYYERYYIDLTSKIWDKLAPWIRGGEEESNEE